jgi:hypothetical protein
MLESEQAHESIVRAPVAETTRRILRIFYGILARAVEDNDSSDWSSIIPETPVDLACEQLMDFFVQSFPGLLECIPDEGGVIDAFRVSRLNYYSQARKEDNSTCARESCPTETSTKFDFLRRLADNLDIIHANNVEASSTDNVAESLSMPLTDAFDGCFSAFNRLTSGSDFEVREQCHSSAQIRRSVKMHDGDDERDAEQDGPATARVKELRRSVAQKTHEVDELEGKIFSGTLTPDEKRIAERRLKRLERALLNDTIALSVAANSSEFSNEVKRLEGKVTVLSTRQDKVEDRLEDLEQQAAEDKRDRDRELQKLKVAVDLLLEERQARAESDARLKQTVDDIQQEQRLTRKTVDVIDNKQRKQSLILHGLRPATAKEDLAKLLPNELGLAIERAHPVTKIARDGTVPIAVHFLTVTACEQARDIIASDDFKKRNGGRVRCAQDESELTRVGGSRLRAISEHLVEKFGGEIEVRRDFVKYGGVKYLAADFALQTIKLGAETIDIDEAIKCNPEAKENPTVRTFVNGRNVVGIRLPRKRRTPDGTPPQATRNTRRQSQAEASDQGRGGAKRFTNNLPIMDGQTSGGVTVFNHGHGVHGGGRAREHVMRVSPRASIGQPAYYFTSNLA